MDNALKELEAELEQLTPTAPSAALPVRIEKALAESPSPKARDRGRRRDPRYRTATTWSSWKWANWTVAAALVALLTIAHRWSHDGELAGGAEAGPVVAANDDAAAGVLRPVRAARTLVDSRPEGIVELPDGSPVERVRDYYVDTIEWRDPSGAARLRWELPRESVRFVALASY